MNLHIYPFPPSAENRNRLKVAKEILGTKQPIQPVPAEPLVRVLAFETPPMICDYALVADTTTEENLAQALRWAIDPTKVDHRVTTVEKQLSRIMGTQVREVVGNYE